MVIVAQVESSPRHTAKTQSPPEAAIARSVMIVFGEPRGSGRELMDLHEAGDVPFSGRRECRHPGVFDAIEFTEALKVSSGAGDQLIA